MPDSKKSWKHKMQNLADARSKELDAKKKTRGILGVMKSGVPGTKEWKEDREAESAAINLEYHFDQDTLDKLKKDTGYSNRKKPAKSSKKKKDDKPLSKTLKDLS